MEDDRKLQKLLTTDQRRLQAIREGVSRSTKSESWHIKHTDNIKRRIDETAKRLGL